MTLKFQLCSYLGSKQFCHSLNTQNSKTVHVVLTFYHVLSRKRLSIQGYISVLHKCGQQTSDQSGTRLFVCVCVVCTRLIVVVNQSIICYTLTKKLNQFETACTRQPMLFSVARSFVLKLSGFTPCIKSCHTNEFFGRLRSLFYSFGAENLQFQSAQVVFQPSNNQ